LWIAEGVLTLALEPYSPDSSVRRDAGLLFIGRDPLQVDVDVCESIGQDPQESIYFSLVEQTARRLGLFETIWRV
jgi:hypothetical protein